MLLLFFLHKLCQLGTGGSCKLWVTAVLNARFFKLDKNVSSVVRSCSQQRVPNWALSFGRTGTGAHCACLPHFLLWSGNYGFFVATWTVKTGMCCVWKKGKGEIKKFNRVKKPFHLTLLSLRNHTKLWVYATFTNSFFCGSSVQLLLED